GRQRPVLGRAGGRYVADEAPAVLDPVGREAPGLDPLPGLAEDLAYRLRRVLREVPGLAQGAQAIHEGRAIADGHAVLDLDQSGVHAELRRAGRRLLARLQVHDPVLLEQRIPEDPVQIRLDLHRTAGQTPGDVQLDRRFATQGRRADLPLG